jgi:hypothetical protein
VEMSDKHDGAPDSRVPGPEEEEVLERAEAGSGDEAEGESVELLELVLQAHAERQQRAKENNKVEGGVVIGTVAAVDDAGKVTVSYPGCPMEEGVEARMTITVTQASVGREVALMFEAGDLAKPIVMGFLIHPETQPRPQVQADGDKIELSAAKEITLRCGEASITLTKAGKILLRGAYISSRSSGVQRIRGGSVQIN